MNDKHYNFDTYDREELRDSFWLANSRVNDVLERVMPGLFTENFTMQDSMRCAKELFGINLNMTAFNKCDYRIRVSFDGGKKSTPEIGVFIGCNIAKDFEKKHRIPLVLVSDYVGFKNRYGENFHENDELKDVLIGGVLNIGKNYGEQTLTLSLSYLVNWILCGPLFDVFWRTRSFDIHCDASLSPFVEVLKNNVSNIWKPTLDYYNKNHERIAAIRSKSEEWRKNSKTCLGFGLNNFALENFTNNLIRAGEIDKSVPIHQEYGWDIKTKSFKEELRKPAQADDILEIAEKERPAYALEVNMFTSPLQGIYYGVPTPRFLMRQAGISFWNIDLDPPEEPTVFYFDLLARQLAGNNTAYGCYASELFSKEPGILNFPVESLPKEFLLTDNKSDKLKDNVEEKIPFVKKLNFQKSEGILMAVNLRQKGIHQYPPFIRRMMCILPLIEAKYTDVKTLNNRLYLLSFLQSMLKFSITRGAFSCVYAEEYGNLLSMLGGIDWSNNSAVSKLRIIAEVEDICQRNNIQCLIHCVDNWSPSQTKNWRGLVPQQEITNLGQKGWVRFSFYASNWGEPFHDVLDGLKNGFLSVSSIGQAPGETEKEILKIFSYDMSNTETPEPCIKRAFETPHEVYDALYCAMTAGKIDVDEERKTNNDVDTQALRWLRRTQSEPVFQVENVSNTYVKSYLDNISPNVMDLMRDNKIAEIVNNSNIDELCGELLSSGFKSVRYLRYLREFWGV